jgi:hypothetical protein
LDGRKPTNSLRIPLKIALKMALRAGVKEKLGKMYGCSSFFFLKEKEEAPGW